MPFDFNVRTPERIVCLTEETTEWLYLLGEEHRIVGVTGYTVRPPQAKKEKPVVSAFIDGRIDKIIDLKPDLVIGFSDIQADYASKLIKAGLNVLIFNQRSVKEIFEALLTISTLVDAREKGIQLLHQYQSELINIKKVSDQIVKKPKVYFEEWDEPMISGIKWVSELIEIAGGIDIMKEKSEAKNAPERIIEDPGEIIQANPDIILVSWCGKKFDKLSLINRKGWDQINAVKNNHVYEIDSAIILQPGPASITDGVSEISKIIRG